MNPNPNQSNNTPTGADSQPEPLGGADYFDNIPAFGDVMDEINPEGPFIPMAELLDKQLIIRSIRFQETRKGPAAFPVFLNREGEIFHSYTGSKVLLPKLQAIANHLPVRCMFVEKEGGAFGRFYDME